VYGPSLIALGWLLLCALAGVAPGEESSGALLTPVPRAPEPVPNIDTSPLEAGEDGHFPPRRQLTKWNEYDGPISTLRFGLGLLTDFSAYLQDAQSAQQVEPRNDVGIRDFRLLASGRFKTERPLSWTFGYMYDPAAETWRVRQSGIQIGFPEVNGNLFIGRTKEGYSMTKVMTGYYGITMERSPGSDAFVPILADGLKWMGYYPGPRVFFSLGAFFDQTTEQESFATYDYQFATRIGWLPIASEAEKVVWHTAVMSRVGRPDEGAILFRSKPEDSLSPYFVETKSMAADLAGTTGFETYYRKGPWTVGGEFGVQNVERKTRPNVSFLAGDVVASWLITGETRAYNARGGFFEPVSPDQTWFENGIGAWEAVLHVSYIDLDDRDIEGGKLLRLTPMMNWYLSDNLRFEFAYGYSVLSRFDLDGHTHFFQGRLQLTL
jgi:phosphate-selective porin OprO/OprP